MPGNPECAGKLIHLLCEPVGEHRVEAINGTHILILCLLQSAQKFINCKGFFIISKVSLTTSGWIDAGVWFVEPAAEG